MGKSAVNNQNNEEKKEKASIPPDGGYGWVIVGAFGFNNIFVISIIYSFGLVFIDKFQDLNFNSSDITNLISINAWFGMILGIFNGPLLKKFGYRRMAFIGITLYITGFLLSGISTEYYHFVICYGMINSTGYVLLMASFSLAINSYFKTRRSHANGRAAFLTGIGPIIFPIITSFLLKTYGVKWTCFLLSALTMNAYVGACLLQPIKWHMKKPKEEEIKIVIEEEKIKEEEMSEKPIESIDAISLFGYEPYIGGSRSSLSLRPSEKWSSQNYLSESNSLKFFEVRRSVSEGNTKRKEMNIIPESFDQINHNHSSKLADNEETFEYDLEEKGCWRKSWDYIKDLYDLDLLTDPIFVNVVFGISIATIGEIFFSLLTPFIVDELGLDLDQSAYFMSTVSFTDTIARLITPYLGDLVKLNSRMMYSTALFLLFITRAFMFLPTSYEGFLVVAAGLGLGKGIRTVYWVIVLPDYVPINKFPSAAAIQSLINGILLAASGPVIGAIISISGSYANAIIACNFLTISTVIMWYTEFGIVWYKNRRKRNLLKGEGNGN